MKLIGMLDSPYVRRVAICLKLFGLPFEHHPVSVFSTFDKFKSINPVVKAPTLVLDDGQVLMDSTLILDYAARLPGVDAERMIPSQPARCVRAYRLTGLALAACEKTVQIVYERNLRPAEKQHAPWVERVTGQLQAAYAALESELAADPLPQAFATFGSTEVTIAVAWQFTQAMTPELASPDAYPALARFSAFAEAQPLFLETPPV